MSAHRLELATSKVLDSGCFSVLYWDQRPFAVSVERTFEPGEAAHGKRLVVPGGLVLCRRSFYNGGGYPTFEMVVEGHTKVLFHKGNRERESKACVLVAESFGVLEGEVAVLDSKGGFNELMSLAEGLQEFYMLVTGR